MRPSPMYGDEDFLLNKVGGVKNVFTANNMQERFRPVHVCLYPLHFIHCGKEPMFFRYLMLRKAWKT